MPAANFQAFFLYSIISREAQTYFLEPFWKGIYLKKKKKVWVESSLTPNKGICISIWFTHVYVCL